MSGPRSHPAVVMTAAFASVALMAALTACGSSGSTQSKAGDCLSGIADRGTLRVGTVSNLPIDAVDDAGKVTGFNGDMLNDFVKDTDIAKDITASPLPFSSLIPSLNADKIDITSDTMFKTPEREKQIAFTDLLLFNPEGLIVKAGNPKGLHQLADFGKGDSIGTYQGTVWVDWVNELQAKQSAKAQVFPSVADLMHAIGAGQVNGGVMSSAISAYMISKNKDLGVELVNDYTPRSRQGVATHLGLQKKCTDLQKKFNTWYAGYVKDGRMAANLNKWGVSPVNTYLEGVAGYSE